MLGFGTNGGGTTSKAHIESFEEFAKKFLYVVLLERLIASPSETSRQIFGVHNSSRSELQAQEEALQMKRDATLLRAIEFRVVRPLVEGTSQFGSHIERLDQAIEVASGALIRQTNKTGLGFLLKVLRARNGPHRLISFFDIFHRSLYTLCQQFTRVLAGIRSIRQHTRHIENG